MLALNEILHAKLKFGLIALAVSLIVTLVMVLSAMSEGLVTGMTGAKYSIDADAVVYQGDTYLALERSLLTADALETIATAEGVRDSYGIGHVMISVDSTEESFDGRVFGLEDSFEQLPIVEGSAGPPGPGEAIVDMTAQVNGVDIGDTLHLTPIDEELTVIGFTEERRYVMLPVFYTDMSTWERLRIATILGRADEGATDTLDTDNVTEAVAGSASIAAVHLEGGTTIDDLQAALGDEFEVVTPEEAALSSNGMAVMILAVDGIQIVSLAIGALVIGVFFYITTLHKTSQIAAVKALGASNGYVYGQLLVQIAILVTVGAVLGTAIALGAGQGMPPAMAFDPRIDRWGLTLASVYLMAFVGSLFSLRSILQIDPATALDHGER